MAPTIPPLFKRPAQRPLVMGIVNVTPDSFSGDGLCLSPGGPDKALTIALQMIEDGADILDIGGESTRPGATPVGEQEEIDRTAPLLAALRRAMPDLPLSIDTMKPAVAAEALKAGASILNDVSGLRQQPVMRTLAAQSGAYLVQMHNSARPEAIANTTSLGAAYLAPEEQTIASIRQDLAALADEALNAGVPSEKIILDPGIGFGKSQQMNLALIAQLTAFLPLGYPLLVAASRKNFIGRVLDLPVTQRLEGTAAVTAISVMQGASILRVHDVHSMRRVVDMAVALKMATA
ncbi:MAG: dihydropteroate synthase [Alphaproteobacteria bacterium]|nr:dihydropteroate synthase [Alphaproteobacteria bacterium]